MDYKTIERSVFDAIHNKDWDRALHYAKQTNPHYDIWQRLPHAAPLPDDFINKALDVLTSRHNPHSKNLASFLFELSNNLPGGENNSWENHSGDIVPTSRETLNRIAEVGKDDFYVPNMVKDHPNFKLDDRLQSLKNASDFWHTYETGVKSHHFATIKSLFTGKPEIIRDHRGDIGSSHTYAHLIPDLQNYSKVAQSHIMADDDIEKRYFFGEPYINLHRGIGGNYGKAIWDRSGYNHLTNEVDDRRFILPTAHLTSWSTDPELARRFAWHRSDMDNQPADRGVVVNQWLPVKSILHSGFHTVVPTQVHGHMTENEIVIGHPDGKVKVSTRNMSFQLPRSDKHQNDQEMVLPSVRKTEGEWIIDLMNSEILKKSLKQKLIPAATALAILGAPQPSSTLLPNENMPKEAQIVSDHRPVQSLSPDLSIDESLKPIQMIESSGGINTEHKEIKYGLNKGTRAYGSFGLMPITILDTIHKNPSLMAKYPEFIGLEHTDPKVHEFMSSHPQIEIDIANNHWNRLRKVFGNNQHKMAHAWLHGVGGTMKKPLEQIKKDPYVQKYWKYKSMLGLEKKNEPVKKSEKLINPMLGVEKFIPSDKSNSRDVYSINQSIKDQKLHDLSNAGKFTHDSFIAGFDPDDSWLIKIEPHNRSAIRSTKYGLQSVRESAFYKLANIAFALGEFTPQAILGEVVKSGETHPAVAIKMYPQNFLSSADADESRPQSVKNVLEKYRKSGDLHKLAVMLYVLGEADAHSGNLLTDGETIKIIDHGTSFGDMKFDPSKDHHIFVPQILRMWGYEDHMSPEEKYKSMPVINDDKVRDEVNHWVHSLSPYVILDILKPLNIDPEPSLKRLRQIQDLSEKNRVDSVINALWTKGV